MTEPDENLDESRGEREEPLGDVAEKVRRRTGERRGSDAPQRDGPLADVASSVDERRRRRREARGEFESIDVGELDGEELWERLAAGDDAATAEVTAEDADEQSSSASETQSHDAVERGSTSSRVSRDDDVPAEVGDAGDGRDVRTIPKETCHGCPHVGDPPELRCTHDGTDILAMPDADHFRVADCPMVVAGEEDIGGIVGERDDEGDAPTDAAADDAWADDAPADGAAE